MNLLRSALLSVSLLSASYTFTMDTKPTGDKPVQQQDQKQGQTPDQKGMLAKMGGLIAAPFVFVVTKGDAAVSFVSENTIDKAVSFVTATKYLKDTRLNNSDNIKIFGKATVVVLTAGLLYKLYTLYNASQEDANDDIIFEEEYDEDNN